VVSATLELNPPDRCVIAHKTQHSASLTSSRITVTMMLPLCLVRWRSQEHSTSVLIASVISDDPGSLLICEAHRETRDPMVRKVQLADGKQSEGVF
jgi:hypothetical protein